jgi:S1 RNA binding domain protein
MQAQLKIGDIVEAQVSRITDFGAFVKIGNQGLGLIHISQIADNYVKNINDHLKIGDKVKARVIKLGPAKKIDLSLKSGQGQKKDKNGPSSFDRPFPRKNFSRNQRQNGFRSSDFEEKLKRFLGSSQRSSADLKKHTEKYHR